MIQKGTWRVFSSCGRVNQGLDGLSRPVQMPLVGGPTTLTAEANASGTSVESR